MKTWTPEQWTAVVTACISALAAAIASIANAFRGKQLAAKIDDHETNSQARAAARGEDPLPPPASGARVGRNP